LSLCRNVTSFLSPFFTFFKYCNLSEKFDSLPPFAFGSSVVENSSVLHARTFFVCTIVKSAREIVFNCVIVTKIRICINANDLSPQICHCLIRPPNLHVIVDVPQVYYHFLVSSFVPAYIMLSTGFVLSRVVHFYQCKLILIFD